jgi:hypothetical protein
MEVINRPIIEKGFISLSFLDIVNQHPAPVAPFWDEIPYISHQCGQLPQKPLFVKQDDQ